MTARRLLVWLALFGIFFFLVGGALGLELNLTLSGLFATTSVFLLLNFGVKKSTGSKS